jgi:predicted DNA-binding WGR domain protein
MRREFYLQDATSNKFWTIEVVGKVVKTTNGRVGSKPRETRTEHSDPDKARRAAEKEINGKLKKGYNEGSLASIPTYRKGLPPKLIRINLDDDLARYVGKKKGGEQFFLTEPFAPRTAKDPGGSYIALYIFDAFGAFKEAKILQACPTQAEDEALIDSLLEGLGDYRYTDIKVSPFSTEAFGRRFGLIFDPGEESETEDDDDEEEGVWVTAEPGDYMAFYPPWDGDYDT